MKILFSVGQADNFSIGDSWSLLHHFLVSKGVDMNTQYFEAISPMSPGLQNPEYTFIVSTPVKSVTERIVEWVLSFNLENEKDEDYWLVNKTADFLPESFLAAVVAKNVELFVMGHKPEGDVIGLPGTVNLTYATILVLDIDEHTLDEVITNNTLADMKKSAGIAN